MGESGSNYGANLYAYLEKEWDSQGLTRGAWCRIHRLADSTVLRWSQGYEPSMENLRVVADIVRVTLPQLLVVCGYIDARTSKINSPAPRERPSVAEAIELDSSIDENERQALRLMHEAFTSAKDGRKRTTRIRVPS